MDDESRGMRRGKPQQQFYRPGSGPLKKSPMGPDDVEGGKPEFQNSGGEPHRRGHGRRHKGYHANKDSNRFHEDLSDRLSNIDISQPDSSKSSFQNRKPDQQTYAPQSANRDGYRSPSPRRVESGRGARGAGGARFLESDRSHVGFVDSHNHQDVRSKRYSGNRRQGHEGDDPSRREADSHRRLGDGRLNSEPRHMSPPRKVMMENQPSRGRDTRSMDSSRHTHHSNGSKPPTGRRNSGLNMGYNLDSMPPRFRKKFLEENGQLDPDANPQTRDGNNYQGNFYGQQHHQQRGPPTWSQTLPTRGRGRLREEDFDREKLNAYLQSFDSGTDSRSSTPHAISGGGAHSGRLLFTSSQENIHSDKYSNYPLHNRHPNNTRNEDYSNYHQDYRHHGNQQANYHERIEPEPSGHDTTRQWIPKTIVVEEEVQNSSNTCAPRVLSQETSSNSISSDTPSSNKLLESITSAIAITAIDNGLEILDWSEEMEKINSIERSINASHPPQRPPREESSPGVQEGWQSKGPEKRREGVSGGPSGEKKGGKGSRRRRRNNGGVRKRNAGNRSSSRGSQRRELSNDVVNRRPDRSPHGQVPHRDHFRDSQEHQNYNHRDVNDKESHREGRGVAPPYLRNEHIEGDRPPSRSNWIRSQYSRENSRDRYSYSRTSSGERGGSRERPGAHPLPHHAGGRSGPGARVDPEGFRLPPPPPPSARNSRNHNRRDSWSARGSRQGSVESGCDLSPPPGRGGPGGAVGGGSHRRRRRDSERSGHAGATPAPNTNWREEMQPQTDRREPDPRRLGRSDGSTLPSDRTHDIAGGSGGGKGLAPGILVLPHEGAPERNRTMDMAMEQHQHKGNPHITAANMSPQSNTIQRTLFDPRNPSKPIIVSHPGPPGRGPAIPNPALSGATDTPVSGRPLYYDVNSDNFKSCHNQDLIREVERTDMQLQWIFKNNTLVKDWERIMHTRPFLQHSLKTLLATDIKFCQAENVEHHFWKMLYYSIIEILRKTSTQDESNKSQCTELINSTIKDGNSYFESLLDILQVTYKFKLEDYLNINYQTAPKGTGFVSLALISAQKIYLFLGDLARYKEQVNDTTNYAKSKNWYTKAHQINPKNGRPYNQLAILAVYARRKLDAVYFYMRSLMSSTPVHSARESLIALLDENRKKYESGERKRQAERQKAAESAGAAPAPTTTVAGGWKGSLRRELWSRAGRTTTLLQPEKPDIHSDEEDLANMTSVELNKRFITSYLHVHGKLITKIGMETFSSSAGVMLRQFRALLRHSPLPINCGRLLQLTALNMFAIDSAHLKDATHRGGCRSELQERALAVSLRMFGALLGRCCSLLTAPPAQNQPLPVHEDVLVILPALKVWSDWMLYHSSVWNPPPPCDDFDVGGESDPWEKLAKLMNLLEPLDLQGDLLRSEPAEDHELVRLPEDTQLSGFTPLMYGVPVCWHAPRALEPEAAHLAVRALALLFLGTQFLCGTDPPALESRLSANGVLEYVSVVQAQPIGGVRERANSSGDSDVMEASLSEGDGEGDGEGAGVRDGAVSPVVDWAACVDDGAGDEATRRLLERRGELETRRRDLEKRRLKMQSLLKQGQVSVELEVRPRYLVPDTNCFIDHLPRLQKILGMDANSPYTLVVPLVVVAELEGLTRAARVAEGARAALAVLRARRPALRFATTHGNLLTTPTFTAERDGDDQLNNDDRILAASLSLCKAGRPQEVTDGVSAGTSSSAAVGAEGVRRLVREVVLLTDDRNLRVKALSRDLPVRDLPAFMRWAALD